MVHRAALELVRVRVRVRVRGAPRVITSMSEHRALPIMRRRQRSNEYI